MNPINKQLTNINELAQRVLNVLDSTDAYKRLQENAKRCLIVGALETLYERCKNNGITHQCAFIDNMLGIKGFANALITCGAAQKVENAHSAQQLRIVCFGDSPTKTPQSANGEELTKKREKSSNTNKKKSIVLHTIDSFSNTKTKQHHAGATPQARTGYKLTYETNKNGNLIEKDVPLEERTMTWEDVREELKGVIDYTNEPLTLTEKQYINSINKEICNLSVNWYKQRLLFPRAWMYSSEMNTRDGQRYVKTIHRKYWIPCTEIASILQPTEDNPISSITDAWERLKKASLERKRQDEERCLSTLN